MGPQNCGFQRVLEAGPGGFPEVLDGESETRAERQKTKKKKRKEGKGGKLGEEGRRRERRTAPGRGGPKQAPKTGGVLHLGCRPERLRLLTIKTPEAFGLGGYVYTLMYHTHAVCLVCMYACMYMVREVWQMILAHEYIYIYIYVFVFMTLYVCVF